MTETIRQAIWQESPWHGAAHRPRTGAPRRLARALVVALLAVACLGMTGARLARAAEWTVPPGINVASQESVLKERVTRAARGLLGDHLIDVVVHIGYVRLQRQGQASQPDRVKLPGFNNFIVPSGAQQPEIVSEFTRVRQAFVMVTGQAGVQTEQLARDLASQAAMDPNQGDTLRVITVNAPAKSAEGGASGEAGAGAKEENRERGMASEAPVQPMTPEELKEPKSTAHLMQARRRYFAGDYQGSLDDILQAITIDPNNAQAFAMLGSLYYAMNWKSLAVKYWQRSLEIDPTNREIEDLVTQIRVQGP